MNDFVEEASFSLDLPPSRPTEFSASNRPLSDDRYLVFCWNNQNFCAVATSKVIEAVPALPLTILPKSPDWLLGIANRRGEILPVINLAARWQNNASTFTPKSRFIILRSRVFDAGVAFTVDKINEIVVLLPADIKPSENENPPYIYGQTVYKTHALNLFDTEKMLSALSI